MQYLIKHVTRYSYSDPVASCHNQVHLAPYETPYQTIKEFRLWVHPMPAYRGQRTDYFGNRVDSFSIEVPHSGITITSTSRLNRLPSSPPREKDATPWELVRDHLRDGSSDVGLRAMEYTFESHYVRQHPKLLQYAQASFPSGANILVAVKDLTKRIHADFTYEARSTTVNTPIMDVFERRIGVCQDFAHLQIAFLRSLGLAARYVSGYLRTDPPPGTPRLVGADASHAWIAVYCGELGWVDFDPTNNKIAGTDHVTVAIGRDYSDVCPIQGVFVGGGQHSMSVSVDVQPVASK
ncbi:MAG: transglutaminase family protein [Planctomycetota bacterium]|nr:transglutaminase family protein [Planctomycetota bacterium]MDA1178350.1 transglutaminase family protein [Planctomycetota bacterium]